jgi:hypothetical protein
MDDEFENEHRDDREPSQAPGPPKPHGSSEGTECGERGEYRERRGLSALYPALLTAAAMVALVILDRVTLDEWDNSQLLATAGSLVLAGAVARVGLRARTTVTAHGVEARGILRDRAFAWSQVHDIRVEGGRRGGPGRQAYLYTTDGLRVRLHHLDADQVADPVAEAAGLVARAVRLGHTIPGTSPTTEERLRRGERRRTALRRAVFGCLAVAALMSAVTMWAAFTDRPTHWILLTECVPVLCFPLFFVLLRGPDRLRADRGAGVLLPGRSSAPRR